MSSASSSEDLRVYPVHLRFAVHPQRIGGQPRWAEPPLGLGYHHGRYEVIGEAHDLEALARWVLGFGAAVEVLGPAALRERVAREARQVAAQYAKGKCP